MTWVFPMSLNSDSFLNRLCFTRAWYHLVSDCGARRDRQAHVPSEGRSRRLRVTPIP